MNPKDLFSNNAVDYSLYRPDYPNELFEFIFSHVTQFNSAWDCGTGNGQAAKLLSTRFTSVNASDISDKQIANAYKAENIEYVVSPAERTPFPNDHFDLITVAQAAHWFQFDKFFEEVKRVGKSNSILAIWGYGLLSINHEFDIALQSFYKNVVGSYWDAERRHIDNHYQSIPFPIDEIKSPEFYFIKKWSVNQLAGYLSTWSSVQKYITSNQINPVNEFIESNKKYLQNAELQIKFPLFLRLGRIK